MKKTQTRPAYDAVALMFDREARLLARKRAHGILRGKTEQLMKAMSSLRAEWDKRVLD